jgi:hypothetical protein
MLLDRSARHALTVWRLWGRCFESALELRHGEAVETFGRRRELARDPLWGAHLETLGTLCEGLVDAEAIARAESGRAA